METRISIVSAMIQAGELVVKTKLPQSTEWRVGKYLHRADGPAIKFNNGGEQWYRYGVLHRDDGPAVINPASNERSWWVDGKRHREDGPAVEWPGGGLWYLNDKPFAGAASWAKALLTQRHQPSDNAAIEEFLRPILANHARAALGETK